MRALLLLLSRQENFKNFCLRFGFFRNLAWRFVAGETLDDAIRAAAEANAQGMEATLDLLGENVRSRSDALSAKSEVIRMLDTIRAAGVRCNASVKLSQLGLTLDTEFCRATLFDIIGHAQSCDNFIRVDMEDSQYTQKTLDLVSDLRQEFDNVGTVIQAYLYRSAQDVPSLVAQGTRIRLCKGAYLEPESVAFRKKRDTDANFVHLMKMLLDSGLYHGIATHDEALIQATRKYAASRGIAADRFEFQMLYGIRRDLQQALVREGYNMRIYIPYGRSWFPYFMRRLAERPANLLFILKNILRK